MTMESNPSPSASSRHGGNFSPHSSPSSRSQHGRNSWNAVQHYPYSSEKVFEAAQTALRRPSEVSDDALVSVASTSTTATNSSWSSMDAYSSPSQHDSREEKLTTRKIDDEARPDRGPHHQRCWLRIMGLTFATTQNQIQDLCKSNGLQLAPGDFDPVNVILISGRPSGRAVVHLQSERETARAVDVLRGSVLDGRQLQFQQINLESLLTELQRMASKQATSPSGSTIPVGVDQSIREPRLFLPISETGNCLKLVGLPFGVAEADVIQFLKPYRVNPDGIFMLTRKGKTTGSCIALMADELEALRGVHSKHKQYIGKRYIEVYPARPCDLYCDAGELMVVVQLEVETPQENVEDNQMWYNLVHPLVDGLRLTNVEVISVKAPHSPMGVDASSNRPEQTENIPAGKTVIYMNFEEVNVARLAARQCVAVWESQQKQHATNNVTPPEEVRASNMYQGTLMLCGVPRVCTVSERDSVLRSGTHSPHPQSYKHNGRLSSVSTQATSLSQHFIPDSMAQHTPPHLMPVSHCGYHTPTASDPHLQKHYPVSAATSASSPSVPVTSSFTTRHHAPALDLRGSPSSTPPPSPPHSLPHSPSMYCDGAPTSGPADALYHHSDLQRDHMRAQQAPSLCHCCHYHQHKYPSTATPHPSPHHHSTHPDLRRHHSFSRQHISEQLDVNGRFGCHQITHHHFPSYCCSIEADVTVGQMMNTIVPATTPTMHQPYSLEQFAPPQSEQAWFDADPQQHGHQQASQQHNAECPFAIASSDVVMARGAVECCCPATASGDNLSTTQNIAHPMQRTPLPPPHHRIGIAQNHHASAALLHHVGDSFLCNSLPAGSNTCALWRSSELINFSRHQQQNKSSMFAPSPATGTNCVSSFRTA